MKNALLFPLVLTLITCLAREGFAGETPFVIGARPWNFESRSPQNHLLMQMRGRDGADLNAGNNPSTGSMQGYPIQSNSYAIGNWIQVEMILGEGADGLIMIENHQTSNGNQQSVSGVMNELIKTYQYGSD